MEMVKPWHEDDVFWETFGTDMFRPKRWEVVPEEVNQMLNLLNVEPGASVLDLCCGPGRHSLELARRGYRVTGVDRTAAYLAEAQKRAEAEALSLELVEDDMRRFCRPSTFDAAVNMFTAFGYFENQDDDRRVLANIYCSLRPGGTLLMEMAGKEIIARIFRERTWDQENGIIFLEERRITQNWSWIENRWIKFENDSRHEYQLGHRLYSATELSMMLSDSGFCDIEVYGDLAGAPYDHQAKRLVVVAKK